MHKNRVLLVAFLTDFSTVLFAQDFFAYYTKVEKGESWEELSRTTELADVVVEFGDLPTKFIFWRGMCYVLQVINAENQWYNNQFNEAWDAGGSWGEPMSDKQSLRTQVRIIENIPARKVIHWRYAQVQINGTQQKYNAKTDWGDWSDEYYYIYPDAVGVRKVVLHTSYAKENPTKGTNEAGHEWQQGIVVYHPFTTPEEYLNIDAVHVANTKGESEKLTKIILHGLTKSNVEGLVTVAKSWLKPAELKVTSTLGGVESHGYNATERAYVLDVTEVTDELIEFEILADKDSYMINPVIILHHIPHKINSIELNGLRLEMGTDFTLGYESRLDNSKAVVWINCELRAKNKFGLSY